MSRKRGSLSRSKLAVLLSFATIANLSGCGQKELETGPVRQYESEERIAVNLFCDEAISSGIWSEPITSKDGTRIQIIDEAASYYNEEGTEAYRSFLRNRLQDTSEVDLYIITAEDVIDYHKLNLWCDLSKSKGVGYLTEDALLQSTYRGEVFSIPLTYTGFGFYWNLDILKRYQLEVPQNLEEFLTVCQVLKENGIVPYIGNMGYALTVPAMAAGFADLYAASDHDERIAALSTGETPVSKYMEKGFELIELMRDKGYIDVDFSLNSFPKNTDRAAFLAGEGAFYCDSLGADLSGAVFPVIMTGIPVLEKGQVSIVGANFRVAVNPNSTKWGYAIEVLEYLSAPEQSSQFAKEHGEMSTIAGSDTSYLGEQYQDFAALVQSGGQIPNQDFNLTFNTWSNIRDICREILQGQTASQAARHYDEIQQKEIAESGEPER